MLIFVTAKIEKRHFSDNKNIKFYFLHYVDPDPKKEIEVDPDPDLDLERGLK